MKYLKFTFFGFVAVGLVSLMSCNDDDGPTDIALVSLNASGTSLADGTTVSVDLNGATSAVDVPPDAIITAEFSADIDATSVNTTNITLSTDEGEAAFTATVSGATVTLTPSGNLVQGTLYTLTISAEVQSTGGLPTIAATRTFTTSGTAPAQVPQEASLVFYVDFNGEVQDANNHAALVSDVTLGTDRFGNLSSAAEFNGTSNYAAFDYANDLNSESHTISYWLKFPASAEYDTHVRTSGYVTFALGGFEGYLHEWGRFDCCDNTFDFLKYVTSHNNAGTASDFASEFLELKGENRQGDNIDEINNLRWLEDEVGEWMLVTTSYDAATKTKTIYINGAQYIEITLVPTDDGSFDLSGIAVNGDAIGTNENNNNNLYLGAGLPFWGNVTSGDAIAPVRGDLNHAFKGSMDDFRIFNVALTDAEVEELYNAERP
ncbi:MAG: Ig-like domain-containing protein [Cytophagales bacterium]|nr:Ig-like domain-containing protein [Cytophagales bacterium]